jgi:membrane protease YdiL (CAAX protease family)
MRPVQALGIFVSLVLAGGALVAPWLYWLVQGLPASFPHLAASPFHRYVNRSLLGLALVGLWPLLRSVDIRAWRDVGLVDPRKEWRKIASGVAIGFISLGVLGAGGLAVGARTLAPRLRVDNVCEQLLGAAGTAVVVALMEELLFRGALFGALRKGFHWMRALLLSSVVYASVHFMESAKLSGPVKWYSGLELLPHMLRGMGDPEAIVPGVLNLTVAGALLALAYQRTGNLWFSIGLHGGWVFCLKCYENLTHNTGRASAVLWGTNKLTTGWLAMVVLTATLVLLEWWWRKSRVNEGEIEIK